MVHYFDFNNMFYLTQQIGFFTILLPFLLIFAIVYSILSRLNIFQKNKGALAIVSVVIAFFSLTNYWISYYMSQLFSNLAIALVTLLAIIIIFGLFNRDVTKNAGPLFLIVAIIASIIVISKAFNIYFLNYISYYVPFLVPLILIILAVVLIVIYSGDRTQKQTKPFTKTISEWIGGSEYQENG